MKTPTLQLGPVSRISIGLISLVIALILIADSALNILPNERKQQIALRLHIAQAISSQVIVLIESDEIPKLNSILNHIVTTNQEIVSVGLRRHDGTIAASSKNHNIAWVPSPTKTSTPTHVIMPLLTGTTAWGEIELTFHELGPRSFKDWMYSPSIALILLLLTAGFFVFYFYLKRALQYLDPSQAVPERVKKAFDTLTEAVVILDAQGRIMLANAGFNNLHPMAESLDGKNVSSLSWLTQNMPREKSTQKYPWESVIQTNQSIHGKSVKIQLPDGEMTELIMNCSAIGDDSGNARGCLISFDDVTELGRANSLLHETLQELQLSQDKIQQQNEELQKIAFYDPLTACLNRRAFFDKAGPLYEETLANARNAVCIMSDIDHFKSFNDKYGHSVGDVVILQVARTLGRTLRANDLLCRYGGEEFCIFLLGFTIEDGLAIGERMRAGVEKEAGPGVRTVPNLSINSSFGVASMEAGNKTLEEMIDQADQALYKAKKTGRNRVIAFDYMKDEPQEEESISTNQGHGH